MDKQLRSQQAAVMGLTQRIYDQLYDARVAWGKSALGQPALCGIGDPLATTSSDLSVIQYSSETAAKFAGQIATRLDAAGWNLRRANAGKPTNPTYTYTARSGGVDISVIVGQDDPLMPPNAIIDVSGPCLNGGSEAHGSCERASEGYRH